jgi:GH24 family phage-related lysozyme (muramidase)
MRDLEPFANAVRSKVTAEISQNQFDALVIFVFNIGVNGFSDSSALKLVNDPAAVTAYPNLEAAWKAWNKSQRRVMQGLVNRRNFEFIGTNWRTENFGSSAVISRGAYRTTLIKDRVILLLHYLKNYAL